MDAVEGDSLANLEQNDRLEDLAMIGNNGYTPNRYTIPLRDGIDVNDLIRGDGTMFETDLERMAEFEEEESQFFDREQLFQQLNYECNDFGDDSGSDEDGDVTPFQRLARGMEKLTEDGGVLKKMVRPGSGPVVPRGATVRYHYNGYTEYNDEPFDSSRCRNRPEISQIDCVVPGLSIGLASMRKGELSKFLVSQEYGLRKLGCPPRIPPERTVLYEVELLSYIDHNAADEYDAFSEEEKKQASFEQRLEVAKEEKQAGNDFYQRKQIQRAISKYLKALRILENCKLQNAEQELLMNEALVQLYRNMAHCSLELGQLKRVLKYSRMTLAIKPRNVKALFMMGKAFMMEGEFKRAREEFRKAQTYEPNNRAIKDALIELDRRWTHFNTIEKQRCATMLGLPNSAKKEGEKPKTVQLSEEKKQVLVKQLREFKEDHSTEEISFPATLTQKEVDCIKQTARDLGLTVVNKGGKGANNELRVTKKTPGP